MKIKKTWHQPHVSRVSLARTLASGGYGSDAGGHSGT